MVLSALLLAPARAGEASAPNLADMSIEQLMNESVTSVSKKETTIGDSPAAIAVVTQDDIRRLGATTIAESLRFVPGLDVARISANQWAISARGFNYPYENKLLVLVDGRSIYTPTFGGVQWDVADTALEDIDQIEVVRGPGASLWGANAVNGVINIITKSAKETQGTLVSTQAGTFDGASGTARVGGRLGEKFFYRTYAKLYERESTVDAAGRSEHDDWHGFQGGFRIDGDTSPENALTLEGDYFASRTREHAQDILFTPPFARETLIDGSNHGVNLLGRWTHHFAPTSELSVQSYFAHSFHSDRNTNPYEDTADLDVQHRFAWGPRHDILWGFGHRYHVDEIAPSSLLVWTPERRTTHLTTGFVQDQISLLPDRLSVILGSKFEDDTEDDVKIQPSLRLLWKRSANETLWAALSRAFKTPARFDTDARLNTPPFQPPFSPPIEVALVGNSRVRVEEVQAHELGYRIQPTCDLSIDLAAFHNTYHDLISYVAGAPVFEPLPAPGHLLLPLNGGNEQGGHTYGAELAVQWRVTEHWRLAADYTWLQAKIRPDPSVEGDSPKHQAHLRSYLELSPKWELNAAVGYVGALTNSVSFGHVPAYTRLDLGLIWRPTESCEAGVWAQNLLDPHHPEFTPLNTALRAEVPRSVTARLTWHF